MKKNEMLRKAGAWVLSAAMALTCFAGMPAGAEAAEADTSKWKTELHIDFGTGTNITDGVDSDLAANLLLPSQVGMDAKESLIAGYGTWVYGEDGMDVGRAYGEDTNGQKIGFDRPLPAGVTNAGGEYFRDWVFSPDGQTYGFQVDLPKGQYYVYVYTGNKTAGYNNCSKVGFSDDGFEVRYDQSSTGGGQYLAPDCVYVVNVEEEAGTGFGTLGICVSDDTIQYKEDGSYADSYTEGNTVFYGTDANTAFAANGNSSAVDGKIVTSRLNGIEIMKVENPVYAESVTVEPADKDVTLEVGQTKTLKTKMEPEHVTERLMYLSEDPSIVSVNPATGVITGVAPGTARIAAATPSLLQNSDKQIIYNVTVSQEMKLTLSPATLALQVDGPEGTGQGIISAEFNAANLEDAKKALASPEAISNATFTLGEVNEVQAPATVSGQAVDGIYKQDIVVKATDKGTGTIKVVRTTGREATCALTVTRPVASAAFYDENNAVTDRYTMISGNDLTVSAKVLPDNASNTGVKYEFAETTDLAKISSTTGKITAYRAGELNLRAVSKADESIVATAKLVIEPAIKAIAFTKGTLDVKPGQSFVSKLNFTYAAGAPEDRDKINKNVTYKSLNPSVASVSDAGVIKGVKAGTATISAETEDGGIVANCKVSVKQPAVKVTVKNSKITLKNLKATAKIIASLAPQNSTDSITYASKNTKIVKVSKSGIVSAARPGTAKVTVTATSGVKAEVTVTVLSPATKIKIAGSSKITLKKGKSVKMKAAVTPKNSTDKVKWSSSKKKVADVSAKGVVKAKSKGSTVITAKARAKSAKVTVKVK